MIVKLAYLSTCKCDKILKSSANSRSHLPEDPTKHDRQLLMFAGVQKMYTHHAPLVCFSHAFILIHIQLVNNTI